MSKRKFKMRAARIKEKNRRRLPDKRLQRTQAESRTTKPAEKLKRSGRINAPARDELKGSKAQDFERNLEAVLDEEFRALKAKRQKKGHVQPKGNALENLGYEDLKAFKKAILRVRNALGKNAKAEAFVGEMWEETVRQSKSLHYVLKDLMAEPLLKYFNKLANPNRQVKPTDDLLLTPQGKPAPALKKFGEAEKIHNLELWNPQENQWLKYKDFAYVAGAEPIEPSPASGKVTLPKDYPHAAEYQGFIADLLPGESKVYGQLYKARKQATQELPRLAESTHMRYRKEGAEPDKWTYIPTTRILRTGRYVQSTIIGSAPPKQHPGYHQQSLQDKFNASKWRYVQGKKITWYEEGPDGKRRRRTYFEMPLEIQMPVDTTLMWNIAKRLSRLGI